MSEDKVNEWQFKESLPEININKLFWKILKKFKNNELDTIPSEFIENAEFTSSVLINSIKKETFHTFIESSKSTIIYYSILLYSKVNCIKCVTEIFRELWQDPALSVAIKMLLKRKDQSKFIKELLEKSPTEFLNILTFLPLVDIEPFLDDIYHIAKNEIGKKQYLSLTILQEFKDNFKIKKLFEMFAEDWDPKVRRISLYYFKNSKSSEELYNFAKKLLKEEDDSFNQSILKSIIKKWETK